MDFTKVGQVTSLSVVVPATNHPATLSRCRAALEASSDPADEIVVIEEPASASASEARNLGAARCSGDVVVFVDADVEVHPDALGRLRAAFDQDPGLTALFGSYDDAPATRTTVSAFRNLLHHQVHQAGGGEAETFWTGLGAVRAEAFAAVGGFDAARFRHPSVEDIDLGQRLRAVGSRIRLDPTIQGTHLKTWTLGSMVWTDFARRGIPWVRLQVQRRELSRTLNLGWRHRASALAAVIALVALTSGQLALLVGGLGGLIGMNLSFYGLLWRRLGPLKALAGVGLHALHHLVALGAVAVGLMLAVAAWRRVHPPRAEPTRIAAPARATVSS